MYIPRAWMWISNKKKDDSPPTNTMQVYAVYENGREFSWEEWFNRQWYCGSVVEKDEHVELYYSNPKTQQPYICLVLPGKCVLEVRNRLERQIATESVKKHILFANIKYPAEDPGKPCNVFECTEEVNQYAGYTGNFHVQSEVEDRTKFPFSRMMIQHRSAAEGELYIIDAKGNEYHIE